MLNFKGLFFTKYEEKKSEKKKIKRKREKRRQKITLLLMLVRAKAIVTLPCRHFRRRYRSKNRCGLSRRPLIKDPTSTRVNPAPFEKSYRRNRYYNKRSFCQMARARYQKRDFFSLSLVLTLLLSFLSNVLLFLWPTSVFSFRMSGRKRPSWVYIQLRICVHKHWYKIDIRSYCLLLHNISGELCCIPIIFTYF